MNDASNPPAAREHRSHRALDRDPRAACARLARPGDAEEFGAWFGVALAGQTFAAGRSVQGRITHPGYEHIAFTAWIERVEPERRLSFRWHPYAIDPGDRLLGRGDDAGRVRARADARGDAAARRRIGLRCAAAGAPAPTRSA